MDLTRFPRSLSRLAKRFRSKEKPSSSPGPSSPAKEGTGARKPSFVEPSKKRGIEQEGETSGWRRAKSTGGGRDEDEVSDVDDRSSAKIRPSPSKKKSGARGSDGEKLERAAAREGQEKRTSSGRETEMAHSPSPAPEVTPTKTETLGSARNELEMAREEEEEEEEKVEKRQGDDQSIMSLPSEKPMPPNEDILVGEKLLPTTPVTKGAEVSQRQGGGVDTNGGRNAAIIPSRSPLASSTSGPGGSNNKESKGIVDEEGGHEGGEKKEGMMSSPPLESDKEETERMREEQEQGDKRSYSEELSPTTMISSSPLPTIANEEMRAKSGVEVSERQGGEGEAMNGGRSAVITSSPSPSLVSTSVQGGSNNKELERIRTRDERARRHESGEKLVGTISSSPMPETALVKRESLESDKEEEERKREEKERGGERSYSEKLSPATTISSSPLPTIANEEMRPKSGVEVSERHGVGEDMDGGMSTEITSPLSPSLLSTSVQEGSNNELEGIGTRDERAGQESDTEKKERNYSETRARHGTKVSERQGEDMYGGRSTEISSPLSPSLLLTSVSVGGNKEEPKSVESSEEQREVESGEKNAGMASSHPTTATTSTKTEILETAEEDSKETELGDQKWSPTTGPTIANEDVTVSEPKGSHDSLVRGGTDEEPESINAGGGQGRYMHGKGKIGMAPIPHPILDTRTSSERKVSGREEIESTREGQVEGDETSNRERRDDDRNVPSTSSMFESVKEEETGVEEKPKRKEEEDRRGASYNGWKAGIAFGIVAVAGTITWIGSVLFLKRRENNVRRGRRTRQR
ncbi:hypothetical protein BHM03_00007387 [Ensete ventricosum]|nr:hypothetical protein BHM03_00007387 [Ensete ventricosum]